MIHNLVVNTIGLGIDVIDLGLSTTPTVEVAVPLEKSRRRNYPYCFSQSKTMECLEIIEKGEF
jgi:phosphomannomutase